MIVEIDELTKVPVMIVEVEDRPAITIVDQEPLMKFSLAEICEALGITEVRCTS